MVEPGFTWKTVDYRVLTYSVPLSHATTLQVTQERGMVTMVMRDLWLTYNIPVC